MTLTACNLGSDDVDTPSPGDFCAEEGATSGVLVCVGGVWTERGLDAGVEDDAGPSGDAGGEDTGTEDTGGICEPESDVEFCQRHGVECGTFVEIDNCGSARAVNCGDFEGFGCGELGNCLKAENISALDTNVCDCPSVDFSASDEEICAELGAQCDSLDPAGLCFGWDAYDSVQCGGCDDDEDCGVAGPNICGCPCEIDGGCQAPGEPSADNPCLVCNPDESTTEFVVADDGTSCGDNAVCDGGDCVCDGGYSDCSGDCVNLDTDDDHCGGCGDACTTDIDGAIASCNDGNCTVGCVESGHTYCEDEELCVNFDTDDDHCGGCGNECGSNEVCGGGTCVCASGYTECGGQCVHTDSHPDHCGGCDQDCLDIEVCSSGSCEENCPGGYEACGGSCVNTDTSSDHCGSCGNDCSGDANICDGGGCVECVSDGDCPNTSFGPWTNCSYPSACAESGTRTRQVTLYECNGGSCESNTIEELDESSCTRTTGGDSCGNTDCDDWSPCFGLELECSGEESRTCTESICSNESCVESDFDESRPCTMPDGTDCLCGNEFGSCNMGVCECMGAGMCNPICEAGQQCCNGSCIPEYEECWRR